MNSRMENANAIKAHFALEWAILRNQKREAITFYTLMIKRYSVVLKYNYSN